MNFVLFDLPNKHQNLAVSILIAIRGPGGAEVKTADPDELSGDWFLEAARFKEK